MQFCFQRAYITLSESSAAQAFVILMSTSLAVLEILLSYTGKTLTAAERVPLLPVRQTMQYELQWYESYFPFVSWYTSRIHQVSKKAVPSWRFGCLCGKKHWGIFNRNDLLLVPKNTILTSCCWCLSRNPVTVASRCYALPNDNKWFCLALFILYLQLTSISTTWRVGGWEFSISTLPLTSQMTGWASMTQSSRKTPLSVKISKNMTQLFLLLVSYRILLMLLTTILKLQNFGLCLLSSKFLKSIMQYEKDL